MCLFARYLRENLLSYKERRIAVISHLLFALFFLQGSSVVPEIFDFLVHPSEHRRKARYAATTMDSRSPEKARCSKCLKSIVTKYISRHQETCKGFQKCNTCQKFFRSLAQHRRYCPPTALADGSVTSSSLTPAGSLTPAEGSPRVTSIVPASVDLTSDKKPINQQSSTGRKLGRLSVGGVIFGERGSGVTESDRDQAVDHDSTIELSGYPLEQNGVARDLRQLGVQAPTSVPPMPKPSLLLRLTADASKVIKSVPVNASRKRSAALAELNNSLNDMTEVSQRRTRDHEMEDSSKLGQNSDEIRKLELQIELKRMEIQEAREAREHQELRDREEFEREKEIAAVEWERQKEREQEERKWQTERDREKREHQREMKRMDIQAEKEREKLEQQKEMKKMELRPSTDSPEIQT